MKAKIYSLTEFIGRWILAPAMYIFLITIGGLLVIALIDGIADSNVLGNTPNWQQLLIGFIVGLGTWALCQAKEYKSPDRGAGR